MKIKSVLSGVVLGAMCAVSAPTFAEGGVKIGTLTCDVGGSVGFIFGSTKDLNCTFAREKGSREHYVGHINNFGVDIGFTSDGVMVWAVIALSSELNPGGLAGDFVGAGADVAVGLGVGANALVFQGGENAGLALQPVSIKGFTGLNAAGGIRGMTLKHQ